MITRSAPTIVFVCQHGAAKSAMAAAYWNRLAALRGVSIRATAVGTDPDPEVSPQVAAALLEEGIDIRDQRPRMVTPDVSVIQSVGVPAASEDFPEARETIVARVAQLLDGCGG